MRKITKSLLSIISSALVLTMALICTACGENVDSSPERDKKKLINEITSCYGTCEDDKNSTLECRLRELDEMDPVEGAKWRSIIALWKQSNGGLKLNYNVLPDGLPDTDELCMVVLGFQLNPDGSMRDELTGRLNVAKASAEKYPNAFVLCTGGPTAYDNKDATEADVMARWLIENGISEKRVIAENKSLTTAQNAMYSLNILDEKYPQVTKLAVISSDYHIASGNLLFGAESTLRAEAAGLEKYEIISNAAYKAPSGSLSTMFQASALNELSGGR